MAEWLKAHAWKACKRATVSRVRIPFSPPYKKTHNAHIKLLNIDKRAQFRSICCFYTVSPTSIERKTLPEKLSKKLPHYPIPVFLLAQLAVNKNFQKQGLGKVSLINALKYLYNINIQIQAQN